MMTTDSSLQLLTPDWPAPENVRACSTTRHGGVSEGSWSSFNLGDHVGDDASAVAANRLRLQKFCGLTESPWWLSQVHGTQVIEAGTLARGVQADASFSRAYGNACVIMTADCLPLLLCDRQGSVVAAVHAGWRGLVAGIIESAINAMGVTPQDLLVWLGPAIGWSAFVVGDDVRECFLAEDATTEAFFLPAPDVGVGRWRAHLVGLARHRLARMGVEAIYGGELCTYTLAEDFYSYRREKITGRMASLIWLQTLTDIYIYHDRRCP